MYGNAFGFSKAVRNYIQRPELFVRVAKSLGDVPCCHLYGGTLTRGLSLEKGSCQYFYCKAAALGGIMLFAMSATAKPTAAMGAELDILTAIILGGISLSGGTGGIVGTVLGMLILGNMRNGLILMNVAPYWQVVLRGIVLMFAVALDSIRTGGYK